MSVQFGQFDVLERRQQKQQMRDMDEQRLSNGKAKPSEIRAQNGFFSVLDRSKAKIVRRRVSLAAA